MHKTTMFYNKLFGKQFMISKPTEINDYSAI